MEQYDGAFALWLAPVQAVVIPIADRHLEYAEEVKTRLVDAGYRTEWDTRNERMNPKIRTAQMLKLPHMRVVGDSGVCDCAEKGELDNLTAPRIPSLQALGDADVGDGLGFTQWLDVAKQLKASFVRNMDWLLDGEYIRKQGKPARYSLTAKGKEVVAK